MNTKKDHGIPETSYGVWGRRDQLIFATFLQSFCWFLSLAVYSYVGNMSEKIALSSSSDAELPDNLMGSLGASVAHYLFYDLCGIMAFLVPLFPFAISMKLFLRTKWSYLLKILAMLTFLIGWCTTALGYAHYKKDLAMWYLFPGKLSISMNRYWGNKLGVGVLLLLATSLIMVLIIVIFDVFPGIKLRMRKVVKQKAQEDAHAYTEEEKEGGSLTSPQAEIEQVESQTVQEEGASEQGLS